MTKYVRMLNNEFDLLDEILQAGKWTVNLKGIGFDYQSLKGKTHVIKFILPKRKYESMMSDQML